MVKNEIDITLKPQLEDDEMSHTTGTGEKKPVCLPCHKTSWIISKFMTNSQDRRWPCRYKLLDCFTACVVDLNLAFENLVPTSQ